MVELPADLWARVLRFATEPSATATSRVVYSAGALCVAELSASSTGVAAYLGVVPTARLPELFMACQLFGKNEELGRHFAAKRSLMAEYARDLRERRQRATSLRDLVVWLFNRHDVSSLRQPRHRKTSPDTLGLSFGVVRERGTTMSLTGGMVLRWVVSRPTTESVAVDLLRAVHGLAREHRPDFPYIWAHVSTSPTTRTNMAYAKDAIAVTLSNGKWYDLPGGMPVPQELLEPGVAVSPLRLCHLSSGR